MISFEIIVGLCNEDVKEFHSKLNIRDFKKMQRPFDRVHKLSTKMNVIVRKGNFKIRGLFYSLVIV